MEVKNRDIDVLISQCAEHLRKLDYSESCIEFHQRAWRDGICAYMKKNAISVYSPDIGAHYLFIAAKNGAPSTVRGRQRNIHILSDYLENGTIAKCIVHVPEYPLTGEIGEVALEFLQKLKTARRCESTIGVHRRMLSFFIAGMALKSKSEVRAIKERDVLDFIGSAQHCKDKHYNTIRQFCRFLHEKGYIEENLEYVLSGNRFPEREKLPSVYSPEEIKIIEASVEQSCPVGKRDYAILLLASRLGLRSSDICGLKFSNVDWDENKIMLTQQKTGRLIELPLLADIGEALVSYLKYARPVSILPEIFLTAKAPYRTLNNTGLHAIISKIMQQSGVDISRRKLGPHAMRHSLAGRLLSNGTSLPVISETLGHEHTQTTMAYLRIDINSLAQCALEVPPVKQDFYVQKGGVFYEQL